MKIQTKMLKKLIAVLCAATITTSGAAVSVGAVGEGKKHIKAKDNKNKINNNQQFFLARISNDLEKIYKLIQNLETERCTALCAIIRDWQDPNSSMLNQAEKNRQKTQHDNLKNKFDTHKQIIDKLKARKEKLEAREIENDSRLKYEINRQNKIIKDLEKETERMKNRFDQEKEKHKKGDSAKPKLKRPNKPIKKPEIKEQKNKENINKKQEKKLAIIPKHIPIEVEKNIKLKPKIRRNKNDQFVKNKNNKIKKLIDFSSNNNNKNNNNQQFFLAHISKDLKKIYEQIQGLERQRWDCLNVLYRDLQDPYLDQLTRKEKLKRESDHKDLMNRYNSHKLIIESLEKQKEVLENEELNNDPRLKAEITKQNDMIKRLKKETEQMKNMLGKEKEIELPSQSKLIPIKAEESKCNEELLVNTTFSKFKNNKNKKYIAALGESIKDINEVKKIIASNIEEQEIELPNQSKLIPIENTENMQIIEKEKNIKIKSRIKRNENNKIKANLIKAELPSVQAAIMYSQIQEKEDQNADIAELNDMLKSLNKHKVIN